MTPQGPLGRDDVIDAALANLASTAPRGAALIGASGQGTSSLASHIAGEAAARGRPVIRLQAATVTSAIGFSTLAPLLPVGVSPTPDLEGIRAVRRSLLERFAEPTIVFVDRADLLDELSAAMLAQLTPDPVIPLLTFDAAADLRPAYPLLRHESVDRFDLVPLDNLMLTEIVVREAGGPLAGAPLRAVLALANGAPAVGVDLVRGAIGAGTLVRHHESWHQASALLLPPSLVERAHRVLDGLSASERVALDHLAIAEPLGKALLVELVGDPTVRALDDRGLLSVAADGFRIEVTCAHPLVTAAIAQDMSTTTRAARARALISVIEATDARREVDLALLGALRLDAGDSLGREDTLAAARRAQTLGRLDLAERLASTAVAAHPGDVESGALWAELLTLTGRNREAERVLSQLEPRADDELALWAMTRATARFYSLEETEAAVDLVDDVIERLADSPWAAELIGLRAVFELFLGRPGVALDMASPHLALDEGRILVEAITAAAPALVVLGRFDEAAELAARGYDRRVALGDQQMLSSPGIHVVTRAIALSESGHFAEALELCRLVYDESVRQGSLDGLAWATLIEGRALLLQGRLEDSQRRFEESAATAAHLQSTAIVRWARAGVVLAAAQRSDATAVAAADALLVSGPSTRMRFMQSEVTRARAWASIVEGDRNEAQLRLELAIRQAEDTGELGMEMHALHDLVRLGSSGVADRMVAIAPMVSGPLAAARVRHGTAVASGEAEALDEAAAAFEGVEAWLLAAEVWSQASVVARRAHDRRGAEDRGRRADELRVRCQGASTPALVREDGMHELTARELEVARLAAAGRRSKEIAVELEVSVRTVDNLLQRCYRKLGVGSRVDLRRFFDG